MAEFPLNRLSTDILFKTLHKMPNIPLCRMRRTCLGIEKLVEENRDRFGARLFDQTYGRELFGRSCDEALESCGLKMSIDFGYAQGIRLFVMVGKYNFDESEFMKRLSCISIGELYLLTHSTVTSHLKQEVLIKTLRSLKITCRYVRFGRMAVNEICELLDLITFQRAYLSFEPKEDTKTYLEALNKSRKRSDLQLCFPMAKEIDLLEHVKNFIAFTTSDATSNYIHVFLWRLYRTQDYGTLESAHFAGNGSLKINDSNVPLKAPLQILWRRSSIPRVYWKRIVPRRIYTLDMNTKIALVTERREYQCKRVDIRFVEKNSPWLMVAIDRIFTAYRLVRNEDFLTAPFERQVEILKEEFLARKREENEDEGDSHYHDTSSY